MERTRKGECSIHGTKPALFVKLYHNVIRLQEYSRSSAVKGKWMMRLRRSEIVQRRRDDMYGTWTEAEESRKVDECSGSIC